MTQPSRMNVWKHLFSPGLKFNISLAKGTLILGDLTATWRNLKCVLMQEPDGEHLSVEQVWPLLESTAERVNFSFYILDTHVEPSSTPIPCQIRKQGQRQCTTNSATCFAISLTTGIRWGKGCGHSLERKTEQDLMQLLKITLPNGTRSPPRDVHEWLMIKCPELLMVLWACSDPGLHSLIHSLNSGKLMHLILGK